jgi:phosphatidate cytidylyltransferase
MNSKNLLNRIITSIILIFLLVLSFNYTYILIISLTLVSLISWIEFKGLIAKIFKKNSLKVNINKFFFNGISLIYLTFFSVIIFSGITQDNFKINILYLFIICICSDVGGLLFGKIFKGKKLTKISPNKTVSGSIGSFILSICFVPIFIFVLDNELANIMNLIFVAIIVSFICQFGDLFFSFLKRKAKVKDTGDILPGHGGLLDRIDGMLFAIPLGIFIWKYLII